MSTSAPHPKHARARRAVAGVALVALVAGLSSGCSPSPKVDRMALAARAETLAPADPRLNDLYQHACRACHVIPASGAPLTGDEEAWRERSKKGLSKMVDNAVAGLNGMPAGGQCVRCTVADYEALIRFMTGEAP